MRLLYLFIGIVLGVLLLSAPAFATGSPFSVSGQVIDRYGNPVQGANVTLLDNSYQAIGEKTTYDDGAYDFVNVVSNTDTVTVRVNFTNDGKIYTVPSYYTRWYAANGIQTIPANEAQFPDYPAPVFGYVYGAIQTDMSQNGRFIDGVVYLASTDENVIYYQFADRTDGKASFEFYVPPGIYALYAQHRENGLVYESTHQKVTVGRNTDITDPGLLPTPIVVSLNSPASNPDPKYLPEHRSNKVSGTVLNSASMPMQDLKVTLFQRSDNMTTFIPMIGADGKPVTRTTDYNGHYEFDGVSPTTDDGKAVQTEKGIRAEADLPVTDNLTIQAVTAEQYLYDPDMIMVSGQEDKARNVVLSQMILNTGEASVPTLMASTPAGHSSITVVPMLAALVIGLICLGGLYWFLNGKGR